MLSLPLHRFAVATACATFVLIVAGALVTSNNAGLSVPDWPLSYGTWMPDMVGGVLYEHSHRMIAAAVGLLTLLLNFWLWMAESPRWLRGLGLAALLTLVIQAILGGVTVLFRLPTVISVLHAALAQVFFTLMVILAVTTKENWGQSPKWLRRNVGDPRQFARLSQITLLTTGAIFVESVLGAMLRHLGSVSGSKGVVLVPSVLVAHLAGAVVVTCLILWVVLGLFSSPQEQKLAYLMSGLLVVQIFLGLGAYLVRLTTVGGSNPVSSGVLVTTLHVAVGTLLLACSLILSLKVRWKTAQGEGVLNGVQEPT